MSGASEASSTLILPFNQAWLWVLQFILGTRIIVMIVRRIVLLIIVIMVVCSCRLQDVADQCTDLEVCALGVLAKGT